MATGKFEVDWARTLHRGRKFSFELLDVRAPDGSIQTREVVRHPGAVVVLPILGKGPGAVAVFIRNFRVTLNRELLELPAGTLEPGEDPARAAARELEEETGYRAATLLPLGRFYTTPGLTDELMWVFVARGLSPVGQRLEADEHIVVCPLSVREALAAIGSGDLQDAKSMLTLLWAIRSGYISE